MNKKQKGSITIVTLGITIFISMLFASVIAIYTIFVNYQIRNIQQIENSIILQNMMYDVTFHFEELVIDEDFSSFSDGGIYPFNEQFYLIINTIEDHWSIQLYFAQTTDGMYINFELHASGETEVIYSITLWEITYE